MDPISSGEFASVIYWGCTFNAGFLCYIYEFEKVVVFFFLEFGVPGVCNEERF